MRAVEIFSVCIFSFLVAINAINLSVPDWFIPIAALIGWLAADLFSGLVHWSLDTFGSVRTPVVGPAFIRPFREHHAQPEAMARHDFIEVNGASCLGCLPILASMAFLPMNAFIHAVFFFSCLGILLTNQCHKWAHAPVDELPVLVKAIQKLGLILGASEHRLHHTPPYNSHFCTASGWLNRPLDSLLRALR